MCSFISNVFKRISNTGKQSAAITGRSALYHSLDFTWCVLRYGANEEDYIGLEFYKKNGNERNRFITSRRNYKWLYKNHYSEHARNLLLSKCQFAEELGHNMKHAWISTKTATVEQINEFIDKLGEVIVKPDLGLCGRGVYKLKADDSKLRKEFIDCLPQNHGGQEHYIVEEVIRQHPDMAYFNESSVNTCRIETIIDKNGKAHITNTIVIIGGVGSTISNTHSGGVMCHVDPESGIVDSKGRNPEGKFYLHHPGNGALLVGRKIPFWKEVLEYAIKLHEQMPTAKYIGWDLAVTPDGPDLIEGNIQCGHCTQACDMVGRWPLIKKYL